MIRLDEHTYQIVWTHHHLLLDGWCVPLILREVLHLFTRFRSGRADAAHPAVDAPAPSYQGYIQWLKRQDLARAQRFWRARLAGLHRPTPLGLMKTQRSLAAI